MDGSGNGAAGCDDEMLSNGSTEVIIEEANISLGDANEEQINIKVKTPMCLVNELARHNHVSIYEIVLGL